MAGGAVGFSTSRILLHTIPDGRYVPGTLAPLDEDPAVADGMNAAGGGLFQAVNDFATKAGHEIELLREDGRCLRRRATRPRGGVGNSATVAPVWRCGASSWLDEPLTSGGSRSPLRRAPAAPCAGSRRCRR